ncbi:hypothetical protein COCNU_06G007780 [Cocos nucifera]|uniref:Uncharacterized protein n=1 Tax=Cocos nucifera TaxID=13894 RepID=A0A8K0IB23_COCNU|nr:hypothetical protein COCNU_06G007780 [Cocos nucifera]
MEHSTPKTLLSLSLVALLFSALIVSPSHSREIPSWNHPRRGGDVAGSWQGHGRMARAAAFLPPSPAANSRLPGHG